MVTSRTRGFTLIELLVVLTIIALLLTLSVPRYFQSVDKSRDTILVENLRITRDTIDKFFADRGRYPESLQELVDLHYLRGVPFDPVLNRNDGWILTAPPTDLKGQVYDLHSGASGNTLDGRAYSDL